MSKNLFTIIVFTDKKRTYSKLCGVEYLEIDTTDPVVKERSKKSIVYLRKLLGIIKTRYFLILRDSEVICFTPPSPSFGGVKLNVVITNSGLLPFRNSDDIKRIVYDRKKAISVLDNLPITSICIETVLQYFIDYIYGVCDVNDFAVFRSLSSDTLPSLQNSECNLRDILNTRVYIKTFSDKVVKDILG